MVVKEVLAGARARLAMVDTDALVTEAAALLSGSHDMVVVTASDGAMAGVVTKTDLVRLLSQCPVDVCMTPVSAVMATDVTYCRPTDLLRDVWSLMKQRDFRHVPVIDGESKPVGVINARDALQALLGEVESEELLLRDYVIGVGYR